MNAPLERVQKNELASLLSESTTFALSMCGREERLLLWEGIGDYLKFKPKDSVIIVTLTEQESDILKGEIRRLHKGLHHKLIIWSLRSLDRQWLNMPRFVEGFTHCHRIVVFLDEAAVSSTYFSVFQGLFALLSQAATFACTYVGPWISPCDQRSQNLGVKAHYSLGNSRGAFHTKLTYARTLPDCKRIISRTTRGKLTALYTENISESEDIAQIMHRDRGSVLQMFQLDDLNAQPQVSKKITSCHSDHCTAFHSLGKVWDMAVFMNPHADMPLVRLGHDIAKSEGEVLAIARYPAAFYSSVLALEGHGLGFNTVCRRTQWVALAYLMLRAIYLGDSLVKLSEALEPLVLFSEHDLLQDMDSLLDYWLVENWIHRDASKGSHTYHFSDKWHAKFAESEQFIDVLGYFTDQSYVCKSLNGIAFHRLPRAFVELPYSDYYHLGGSSFQRVGVEHAKCTLQARSVDRKVTVFDRFDQDVVLTLEQSQRVLEIIEGNYRDFEISLSKSATKFLAEQRAAFSDIAAYLPGFIEYSDDIVQIWTFGGARMHTVMAMALRLGLNPPNIRVGNFSIYVEGLRDSKKLASRVIPSIVEALEDDAIREEIRQQFLTKVKWFNLSEILPKDVVNTCGNSQIKETVDFLHSIENWQIKPVETLHFITKNDQFSEPPSNQDMLKRKQPLELVPEYVESKKGLEVFGSPYVFSHKSEGDSTLPLLPVFLVDTQEKLHAFIDLALKEKYIALDVETTLYRQSLCLIQFATRQFTFLIDAQGVNFSPLRQVLENPNLTKIIHHAVFEKSVMKKYQMDIHQILDTESLSRKLRREEKSHSLQAVCKRELGIVLDKSCQTSKWEQRPLSEAQVKYAALDAEVLIHLYHHFHKVAQPRQRKLF